MRLTQPFSRALIALGFSVGLSLLLVLATAGTPVLARPSQQAGVSLTVTPTEGFGNPGQLVVYTFTVTNNTGAQQTFTITVGNSSFNAEFPSGNSVTVGTAPNNTAQFTVGIRVPTGATPGTSDDALVQISTGGTNAITASRTIVTTVTVNNATVTPTGQATVTPTPTGTVGPSPTPGPVCRDRFEPDDQLGAAKEIRPDAEQTRAICPAGDEDWAFFGAVSGKVYTIDITAMDDGLDLSLSLYDEVGNLLAFNDDFPRNNDPSDIRPRIQSYRIPANGRYFIKVRDNAGRGNTGLDYTLLVASESYGPTPTLVAELCLDLYEPDGVPQEATDLVIREIQPNHRFCPSGDADWVRFFAKAGQQYVLSVESGVAGSDPVMILVDRDGATIFDISDDFGGTLDPRIEFTVDVDGFYFAQLKNVGDVGNQFISYTLTFEAQGAAAAPQPTAATTTTPDGGITATPTTTGTPGTATPTTTGTPGTTTPTTSGTPCPTAAPYPPGCPDEDVDDSSIGGVKGGPKFVNGAASDFVDPAMRSVWNRTDAVVASRQVDRSWMWGPQGLVARVETYTQANGGARQVQYFDKARMEITDWSRDRANPWFVTNGLLVREMIDGVLQIGDAEGIKRQPAAINVAGDSDDANGPTYGSFAQHTARAEDRVGQTVTSSLNRDGSIGKAAARPEAKLATYVSETGHNIPQVFWDFLNASGPVGDGSQNGRVVDWVFAMGYPVSEAYWTKVKVGGVEKDVLVQAFQRRVLTYTPSNPEGWKVEMGNVGRHYYAWRYGKQP